MYAIHIVNACPAKNVMSADGIPITPFEFSYGRKPSLTNFRVFGCPTFIKRYNPHYNKRLITHKQQLQRSSRGIFLVSQTILPDGLSTLPNNRKALSLLVMPILTKILTLQIGRAHV